MLNVYFLGGGGGGGVYVGSGPTSTVHPKKYQEFQAPQNNIWNFTNPQNYPPLCTLTLRKYPKMHRNDPVI